MRSKKFHRCFHNTRRSNELLIEESFKEAPYSLFCPSLRDFADKSTFSIEFEKKGLNDIIQELRKIHLHSPFHVLISHRH